ncbi:unnamed protein product [Anisakis simplex]|uniref:Transmembrane protein n=1 Tax=Anisakis simplex TaxID=6269 RepID=A0A0M3JVL5_ANISI|nr:unnamed protein product [Anisakis simplex]
MVDCLVTVAGGGEEELIKCLAPSYSGAFEPDGLNYVMTVLIGLIILGSSVMKRHIMNANLMRNVSDFTVHISTGQNLCRTESVKMRRTSVHETF